MSRFCFALDETLKTDRSFTQKPYDNIEHGKPIMYNTKLTMIKGPIENSEALCLLWKGSKTFHFSLITLAN